MKNLSLNTLFFVSAFLLGLGVQSLSAQQEECQEKYYCDSIIHLAAGNPTKIEAFDESGRRTNWQIFDYSPSGEQILRYKEEMSYDKNGDFSYLFIYSYDDSTVFYTQQVKTQYQNDSIIKREYTYENSRSKHYQIASWEYDKQMQLQKFNIENFNKNHSEDKYYSIYIYEETYNDHREAISKTKTVYDSLNITYKEYRKYTYNNQGQETAEIIYKGKDGDYIPFRSFITTYNLQGKEDEYICNIWKDGEWLPIIKETNEYNSKGKLDKVINARREGVSTDEIEWEGWPLWEYIDGHCDYGLHLSWFNYSEIEVSDSTNSRSPWIERKTKRKEMEYEFKGWEDKTKPGQESKKTSTDKKVQYDKNGNILQEIIYTKQRLKRIPFCKKEYEYNRLGLCIKMTKYNWKQTQWETDGCSEYKYDGNGNITKETSYWFRNNQWVKTTEVRKHWKQISKN